MASLGALMAFNFLKRPSSLIKMTSYSRISCKFFGKFCITVLIALIPVIAFLNPFWGKIDLNA
jgi:hypothetical protein